MGVIPIVNENDTLAVSEIKFGDNDTLSAITAAMIHADLLFLMTDVDCLYDKNPRSHPDAKPIEIVEDISALEADGMSYFHKFAKDISLSYNKNSLKRWVGPRHRRYEYKDHRRTTRDVGGCNDNHHQVIESRKRLEHCSLPPAIEIGIIHVAKPPGRIGK